MSQQIYCTVVSFCTWSVNTILEPSDPGTVPLHLFFLSPPLKATQLLYLTRKSVRARQYATYRSGEGPTYTCLITYSPLMDLISPAALQGLQLRAYCDVCINTVQASSFLSPMVGFSSEKPLLPFSCWCRFYRASQPIFTPQFKIM